MRVFAAWLMILCLALVQAHDLVPHHHHSADAPAHGHTVLPEHSGDRQFMTLSLDAFHPELASHQEGQAGRKPHSQSAAAEFVLTLPNCAFAPVLPTKPPESREFAIHELPFGTGPPGTNSSRAPPSLLIA